LAKVGEDGSWDNKGKVGEKCDHVLFCFIITGVAVHVRKVAHPKY